MDLRYWRTAFRSNQHFWARHRHGENCAHTCLLCLSRGELSPLWIPRSANNLHVLFCNRIQGVYREGTITPTSRPHQRNGGFVCYSPRLFTSFLLPTEPPNQAVSAPRYTPSPGGGREEWLMTTGSLILNGIVNPISARWSCGPCLPQISWIGNEKPTPPTSFDKRTDLGVFRRWSRRLR